jgi:hypothetical protein
MNYSFCETQWATADSKWHIRELSDKGRKLGGGADTPSLCEREMAWDLKVELTEFHVDNNTCAKCRKHYLEKRDERSNLRSD